MNQSPNPAVIDADTLTGDMRPIRRCVVSIGSNLGDRMYALQGALDALGDTPEVWLTGVSSIYETEPVDAPEGSESFLNAVLTLDTTLAARTLLERAHAVEAAYGRDRSADVPVNSPRTLDVDLIVVGDKHADDENLRLPHPRAAERAFVLVPWSELEPDADLPGYGTVAELLEKTGRDGVVLREDLALEVQ